MNQYITWKELELLVDYEIDIHYEDDYVGDAGHAPLTLVGQIITYCKVTIDAVYLANHRTGKHIDITSLWHDKQELIDLIEADYFDGTLTDE